MADLQLPTAGRACKRCQTPMVRVVSGSLRWRCPSCAWLSDRDPYLESVEAGAPTLPGLLDDES